MRYGFKKCQGCGEHVTIFESDLLSPASPCSSRRLESQVGGKAMCEAIAALKPVCDDMQVRFIDAMIKSGRYSNPQIIDLGIMHRDVVHEILCELTEKANSTAGQRTPKLTGRKESDESQKPQGTTRQR